MSLNSGDCLQDRYRIEGILGHGGMGAVYLATDESLGVQCAIKENLNFSPESERQFKREANLLASLRHPNLPRVTDHFILGNQQYLVMDFVEGEDLKERLEAEGPLLEADVLRWANQICCALSYLHHLTPPIVHRDIKPTNIKITPAGEAMLVDFGIAKAGAAGQKTTTGAMGLTPGYAPPEQYGTGQTDARTDEYALAATLYHLLTGVLPPDSMERLLGNKTLSPIEELRPDLTPHLAAALTHALAVNPNGRFENVTAFRAALTGEAPITLPAPPPAPQTSRPQVESVAPTPATLPAPRPARPHWLAPAGVGGAVIVVALLIFGLAGFPGLSGPHATATLAPTEIVLAATATASLTTTPTPIPVPPTATPTPTSTFTPTDTATPTATPTPEAISPANADRVNLLGRWGKGRLLSARWSPDGKYLGVNTSRGAYLYAGDTLQVLKVFENASILAFGPPGQAMLRYAQETQMVDWPSGQVLRALGEYDVLAAAFGPDGKTLAISGRVSAIGQYDGLAILNLTDGTLRVLQEGKTPDPDRPKLAFAADGNTLVATVGNGVSVWDVAGGRKVHANIAEAWDFQISPDGSYLLLYENDKFIVQKTLTGGQMRQINADGSPYFPSGRTAPQYLTANIEFTPDSTGLIGFYYFITYSNQPSEPPKAVRWEVTGGPPTTAIEKLEGLELNPYVYDPYNRTYDVRNDLGLDPKGDRFFSLTVDGILRLWDFATGKVTVVSDPHYLNRNMALRPDGKAAALPNALGVDILDLASGEVVDQLRGFLTPREILKVIYVDDSLIVQTTQSVEHWDPATHNQQQRISFEGDYYFSYGQMVVSPDGGLFAVRDKYLTIYETASGQPRHVLGSPNTRGDFLFTPDGKYLVLASGQGVGLWETETGKRELNLAGSGTEVGVLALTPDGTRLVSSTGDVWDMDTFQLITTFRGSSAPGPVTITADGNVIAASDGTLWDANTGEQVGTLAGLRGPATYLAFTSDGQRLIWQTEDGVIDVWGIQP